MSQTLTVLGAWCAFAFQAEIENPEYRNWSGFKAGASVKFKMTSETAGTKTESEQTVKLLELTGDKAVVETAMVFGGNALPGQKRDVPAKIKKVEGDPSKAPKPVEGDEEIEVAGKKVKCRWVETTTEAGGNRIVSRVWMSKEVPGGMAKMESKTTGQVSSATTMIAIEIK